MSDAAKPSRWRSIALLVIKLAITTLLLVLLARRVPLGEAFVRLDSVGAGLWFWGIGLNGAVIGLAALRWHFTALRTIPLRTCFEYTWIGQFFSLVLPGNVVGDVAKTASLAVGDARHRSIVLPVSVVLDRLLGLLALTVIFAAAVTGMWWDAGRVPVVIALGAVVAASVFTPQIMVAMLALAQRVRFVPQALADMLEKTTTVISRMKGRPWLLLLALSLVMHMLTTIPFVLAARRLGMTAELWRLGLYYVGMNLIIMLPVTFAGVGAREQFSVWLLGTAASAAVMPVTLSWYLLLISAVHALVGAILQGAKWLRGGSRVREQPDA